MTTPDTPERREVQQYVLANGSLRPVTGKGYWVATEDYDALLARLRAAEARAERYRRALEGWREDVARVERYAMENPGTTPEIVAARLRDVLARRALADRGADA